MRAADMTEENEVPSLVDRKVRLPRVWSNRELEKFARDFGGHVVNVSAWIDEDKEGRRYRDYFTAAASYSTTNYVPEAKGLQENLENQIFLNLEEDLAENLRRKFDVVFNHTVLEHVFECGKAFENLCEMSADIVIVVVPFIQHQHAAYGDYWRFTPEGVSKLYQKNGLELVYINYNDGPNQSIYVFAIGARHPQKWQSIRAHPHNKIDRLTEKVGHRLVRQGTLYRAKELLRRVLSKLRNLVSPPRGSG
jgi:hypothetical protein